MHQLCYEIMERFCKIHLAEFQGRPMRILDVGSQDVNGTFKPLFEREGWTYIGLDIDSGLNVDFIPHEPYYWDELNACSFDVVISGQAFEHTEFFWLTMLEISRVLKDSGLCCLISPSSGFEHRYPVDCYRFYRDGMAAIGKYGGMEVLEASTLFNPDREYADGSHFWKDSALMARKKKAGLFDRILLAIYRGVSKKLWNKGRIAPPIPAESL
ncbi:MAG: class I SAM-dependent methyltransferase [Opitutae bacterium]|jgi:SAM-dependent methyltransferase|nr:class I SAM-dependent methyltransferase [Opitutae bacterium]